MGYILGIRPWSVLVRQLPSLLYHHSGPSPCFLVLGINIKPESAADKASALLLLLPGFAGILRVLSESHFGGNI